MSQLVNHKTNFTSGAVSMDLLGRTDLAAYDNGALELKNMFISPIGGVERRSGLRYVDTIASAVRLISFTFNTEQVYLCVVGDKFIRIYKNETLLQTLVSPWLEEDIPQLRWTQSADTLLLTHPDYEPKVMTRQSNENFVLSPWTFDTDTVGHKFCPYEKFDTTGIKMSAQSNGVNITLTTDAAFFQNGHVGVHFKVDGGEFVVVSIVDSTHATADQIQAAQSSALTLDWLEEAFSSVHGYPVCVTFYQGRLVIGGSRDLPNKLWFSKSFAIMNFDTGTGLDDEAIGFSLLSDQVNAICGLMPGRHLQVFTSGSEWMVSGEPLTPQSIQLKRQTRVGSPTYRFVPPVDVSGATLFVSENGHEVREFLFADLEQAYQAKNVSLLSGHLIQKPTDMDYDPERRLVYVIMEDGQMATLTNYRSEDVLAWSMHETAGQFLSVCVVGKDVYFLIKRGNNVYLETFDDEVLTDCAFLGEDTTAHTTWTGLTPLVGQEVQIIADGQVEESIELSSSSITLPKAVKRLEVGLPYTHTVVPLPPVAASSMGNMPLKAVRLIEARFKVINTASLKLDIGNGYTEFLIKKMNNDYVLDSVKERQTQDVCVHALGWVRNCMTPLWKIQSDIPLPCKIVSVTSIMKVSE